MIRKIPEERKLGMRLGRHVDHDERSRNFPIPFGVVSSSELKTVHHRRFGRIFDQETQGSGHTSLGSCTGNAVVGCLNTVPIHKPEKALIPETRVVDVYSLATQLDEFPGTYPPDDTGSSGLAAAKAAQQLGLIAAYHHAFSIEEALTALQYAPVITGVDWYEGFDSPAANGMVKISGAIRGGHEFEVLGFEWHHNLDDSIVIAANSWTSSWGLHGRFKFTVKTWRTLLDADGDVTILV